MSAVDNCAKLLLTVANLVLDELYSNWATAVDKAIVTSTNGIIDTQHLSLNKVISLTDSQGQSVPFRYTERGLFVDCDGTFNLTYTKLPTHVGWNEEFASPSPSEIGDHLPGPSSRESGTQVKPMLHAAHVGTGRQGSTASTEAEMSLYSDPG